MDIRAFWQVGRPAAVWLSVFLLFPAALAAGLWVVLGWQIFTAVWVTSTLTQLCYIKFYGLKTRRERLRVFGSGVLILTLIGPLTIIMMALQGLTWIRHGEYDMPGYAVRRGALETPDQRASEF
jgi:hypothetical protein